MKKLRIALILLLAMSFSMFLFACGGGDVSSSGISKIELSGNYKTTYIETDKELDTTGLVVKVRYKDQAATEELTELTAEQYDVTSDVVWGTVGSYTVTVTPKGQDTEEGAFVNTATYTVTVDHDWGAPDENGKYECNFCHATKTEKTGFTDNLKYEGWADGPKNLDGNTYVKAATGTNTATVGELGIGTKITIEGIAQVNMDDNGNPANANTWNFPMLGVATLDGKTGMIMRNDNWMIYDGISGAPAVPGKSNADANTGALPDDAGEWTVYQEGTTCASSDYLTRANIRLTWNYRQDGVMECTTENITAGKTVVRRFRVPLEQYQALFHGEQVNMTITSYSRTENLVLESFTIKEPTRTYYAEGTMLDPTTIAATANYLQLKDVPVTTFSIYADTVNGEETVEHNLRTEQLTADMTNFRVTFAGTTIYLYNGLPNDKPAGESLIKVTASDVRWADPDAPVTIDGVKFVSDKATYTYDADAQGRIVFNAEGSAGRLTDNQKSKLSTNATHFIALRLTSVAALGEKTVTVENAEAVKYFINGAYLDIVIALDSTSNDVVIKGVQTNDIHIVLPEGFRTPAVETTRTYPELTLDKGGEIEVTYYGEALKGKSLSDLKVTANSRNHTLQDIKDAKEPLTFRNEFKVKSVDDSRLAQGIVKVTYLLEAPDLSRGLNEYVVNFAINGDEWTTVSSESFRFDLKFSDDPVGYVKLGSVYATSDPTSNSLILVMLNNETNLVARNYELKLNVSEPVTAKPTELNVYDLSVAIDEWGEVSFMNPNDVSKKSSIEFSYFGTMSDDHDYDFGGALIVIADLSAANVRATDWTKPFYFEIPSETELAIAKATYTKGDAAETYATGTDTLTKINVSKENIETLVEEKCLDDGMNAYKYQDGSDLFYWGAEAIPATGVHEWSAWTQAAHEERTCSRCGTTQIKDVKEGFTRVLEIPGPSKIDEYLQNTDTSDAWWADGVAAVTEDLTGDFAVRYTYEMSRDSFRDVVIQITDGTNFGTFEIMGTQSPWPTDPITKDMTVKSITDNGAAREFADATAAQTILDELASVENAYHGKYSVTFVRLDDKMTITVDFTRMKVEDGVLTELAEGEKFNRVIVLEIPTITTEALTIQFAGNPYWVDSITRTFGTILLNGTVDIGIGAEDGSTAYTGNSPLWTTTLLKGQKIVLSGTMKSGSETPGNWNTVLLYMWGGATPVYNFRADWWINGVDDAGNGQVPVALPDEGWDATKENGPDWGTFASVIKDCNITLTFDWTDESKIVLSFAGTNAAEQTFTMQYSIVARAGRTLANSYKIGLGTDNSYTHITSIERPL